MKIISGFFIFLILANTSMDHVWSLKCFSCYSTKDCKDNPNLVECNSLTVQETATRFTMLPKARRQSASTSYGCAAYTAKFDNSSDLQLSGCFYDTYNPCADDQIALPSKMWSCKYCDVKDGCNFGLTHTASFALCAIATFVVLSLKPLF